MSEKPKEILELERELGIESVDGYGFDGEKVISLTINKREIINISFLTNFPFLKELNLSFNKISDLNSLSQLKNLQRLDLTANEISDITPISKLNNLKFLSLINNNLEDISPLTYLTNLIVLSLSQNFLIETSCLVNLKIIEYIDLSFNYIEKLKDLSNLKKLKFIDLTGNKINNLSNFKRLVENGFEIKLIQGFGQNIISLALNPIVDPPESIILQGNKAILEYFDDIEKYGEFEILEAKLLIVGEPRSGKTTLRKKIFDPSYKVPCEEDKETIGVNIQKGWVFPFLKEETKNFTANIWDFGGQERQYPLHQFFMDDVSCYVLVSDDRADNVNMDKWFGMIKLLGGNQTDVLVILNQINRSTPSSNFNKERYEKQGFNIETFSIDFRNDAHNISELLKNIQSRICKLGHIGQILPKKICEPIRNEIFRLKNEGQKNYITIEEYYDACIRVNLNKEEEQKKALNYLKWIGDVIHYDDDSLDNIIILNPIWLTQAIYAVITSEELDEFHKKGIFDKDWFYDFMVKTSESKTITYSKAECKHILNFMLKNNLDICYTSDGNNYVVPLCMPDKLPDHHFNEHESMLVLFRFESLPPGLISRLIVRLSEYIEDKLVAKNATVLKRGITRAKLDEYFKENDANQYMKIAVTGTKYERYELMNEIKSALKDIIRKSFKNLIYEEEIPCKCQKCSENPKPFFHKLEKIRKRINNNKKTIECDITGNDVSISIMLGHVNNKKFDSLMEIKKLLEELLLESRNNGEFNMAFSAAFTEINETILNIDGNTSTEQMTESKKLFEKLKTIKDGVEIGGHFIKGTEELGSLIENLLKWQ